MDTGNAEQALRTFASAEGVDPLHVTASQLTETMTAWYEAERAEDVVVEESGDMLLFQWGTYDWGDGEMFEVDLTRQLIAKGAADDDAIWQLSWKVLFAPSVATAGLGEGNRWCGRPSEVDAFRGFIGSSDAMRFAASHPALRAEVNYGEAG